MVQACAIAISRQLYSLRYDTIYYDAQIGYLHALKNWPVSLSTQQNTSSGFIGLKFWQW